MCATTGVRREAVVRSCRFSSSRGGQALLEFEGVSSMDEAEKLKWMLVQVPIAERVELPAGSYYVSDLEGCAVVRVGGERVGVVREVEFTGESGGMKGTPVLVVDGEKGEVMIPLAEEMCRVDLAAKRIEVSLPEGLEELNEKE